MNAGLEPPPSASLVGAVLAGRESHLSAGRWGLLNRESRMAEDLKPEALRPLLEELFACLAVSVLAYAAFLDPLVVWWFR
jgi:hypothetical protein